MKTIHPTILTMQNREAAPIEVPSIETLSNFILSAGVDDFAIISIDNPDLASQRSEIIDAYPKAKSVISLVSKMNPEAVRTPLRSGSNLEFHSNIDNLNLAARSITQFLSTKNIKAITFSSGFPMEMDRFPGKIWVISHKPVAVAGGLGRMGLHRNVIHPKFGSFINLETIIVAEELPEKIHNLDYNPCLTCKLCVAACPVGAIAQDGAFNFSSCMTHNYKEFMSGFTDWVETIADSKNSFDYRSKVKDSETASMWQSLSYGSNYKAAYCLAVCPAGEDVIGEYLSNKGQYLKDYLKPLQDKIEPIYVMKDSDAKRYVEKKFPHKNIREIRGIRPVDVASFLRAAPLVFQPEKAKDVLLNINFKFLGEEEAVANFRIENKKISVSLNLSKEATTTIVVDSKTWVKILRKEKHPILGILTGKLKVKGKIKDLKTFESCFP